MSHQYHYLARTQPCEPPAQTYHGYMRTVRNLPCYKNIIDETHVTDQTDLATQSNAEQQSLLVLSDCLFGRPQGERLQKNRQLTTAICLAFEVIDRRRNSETIRQLCTPSMLRNLIRLSALQQDRRNLGVAIVRKVHMQVATPSVLEVFGSYTRGERTFAYVGQLQHKEVSWKLTDLILL